MKFRIEPKKLGKLLGELRLKASLSQSQISKVCKVNSPQYISNIERGQCLPSLKILKQMLEQYKVSAEDKKKLIHLFLMAAKEEVEDIFKTNVKLDIAIDESAGSYAQLASHPSAPYTW